MPYTDAELMALYGNQAPVNYQSAPSTPTPTSNAQVQAQPAINIPAPKRFEKNETQQVPARIEREISSQGFPTAAIFIFVSLVIICIIFIRRNTHPRKANITSTQAGEESHYEAALEEFTNEPRRKGLWVKALAMCEGNEDRAQHCYIKLRVEQRIAQETQQRQQTEVRVRSTITKAHFKQLGFGLLVLTVGLVFTAYSYNTAEPGGRFIVTSGAILGGFVITCKGLWGVLRAC